MSFFWHLLADLLVVLPLAWKASKLIFQKHQKMFETESDYKLRKFAGYAIIGLCLVAILVNHMM